MDIKGKYKGIVVPYDRVKEPAAFEAAVFNEIIESLIDQVPENVVQDQLLAASREQMDALIGEEGSMYFVLADISDILQRAYREASIQGYESELKDQAMDITIKGFAGGIFDQAAGGMKGDAADLKKLISDASWIYLREEDRPLFGAALNKAAGQVLAEQRESTEEERRIRAFEAYMDASGTEQEAWRSKAEHDIRWAICRDMLLDRVADAEGISASDDEKEGLTNRIAEREGVSTEEIKAQIHPDRIERYVLRSKARRFILDSAQSTPW